MTGIEKTVAPDRASGLAKGRINVLSWTGGGKQQLGVLENLSRMLGLMTVQKLAN